MTDPNENDEPIEEELVLGLEAAFGSSPSPPQSDDEAADYPVTGENISALANRLEFIADYRVIREIGVGGMGVVYEAEQQTPKRLVALKIARASLRPTAIERFRQETQLLGRLQHPAIAEIYEAGHTKITGLGRLSYFVMALVEDAMPITDFAEQRGLDEAARVELCIQALDGVAHGHLRGVIHRDLKPSNVLVDRSGHVKIIDFGLARALDPDEDEVFQQTRSGELIGTPQYMSPEQWTGPADVGPQSDVYSMGVLLFELLTGRLPFDLTGKGVLEIGEIVRTQPPSRLSLASNGRRSDLDVIIRKALEKERQDRYLTAAALIDDLGRFLANQPIAARPPSAWYQLRKFARRHRALVAALLTVLVVSVVAAVVSTSFAISATQRGNRLQEQLYAAQIGRAFDAYADGNITYVRNFLDTVRTDRSSWEWQRLQTLVRDRSLRTIHDAEMNFGSLRETTLNHFDASPDGRQGVSAGLDGHVRIWDLTNGELVRDVPAHRATVLSVRFDAVGERVISADETGVVQIRNVETGELTTEFVATHDQLKPDAEPSRAQLAWFGPGAGQISVLVWHPQFLARIFDLQSKEIRYQSSRQQTGNGIFAPIPGADAVMVGLSVVRGIQGAQERTATKLPNTGPPAVSASFQRDGTHMITGCRSKTLQKWNLSSLQEPVWDARGHDGIILATALSPDETRLATGGADHKVMLWDAATGAHLRTLHGHRAEVYQVRFLPDGQLVSSSADQTIKVWDVGPDPFDVAIPLRGKAFKDLSFDSTGSRLAASGNPAQSVLLDCEGWATLREFPGSRFCRSADFRPGTEELAIGSDAREVVFWNAGTGSLLAKCDTKKYVTAARFHPAATKIAVCDFAGEVRLLDAETHAEQWIRAVSPKPLRDLAYVGQGRWIVTGGDLGRLAALRLEDGKTLAQATYSERISALAAHPSKDLVAAAGSDGVVRICRLPGLELVRTLPGLTGPALSLAYLPTGDRLLVGYATGVVKLWSSAGDQLCTISCFDGGVRGIAVSPGGETIAVCGDAPTLRIWKIAPQ